MSLETLRDFLLISALINYGFLLVWFLLFTQARGWMRRLHGRWFQLRDDQFDAIHYLSMALFKLGILLLNLVPGLALCLLLPG